MSSRPTHKTTTLDLKRKADDGLSRSNDKVLKNSMNSGPSASLKSALPNSAAKVQRPTVATSSSALAVPYRGTSKARPNSASPITQVSDTLKAPPKKGSFAEIMARAKSLQAAAPAVGVIKHKPKETISNKKEILLQKQSKLGKRKPGSKVSPPRCVPQSMPQNGSPSPVSGALVSRNKPVAGGLRRKTASPPAYRGTASAKPAKSQPSYKGTMKPVSSPNASSRKTFVMNNGTARSRSASLGRQSATNARYNRYISEDEDEDEDGEEEEEEGDESDDMEAGFLDVEEEERDAIKVAKKEDEEQARIELQMKRKKEERKKGLELLAKRAKKRAF